MSEKLNDNFLEELEKSDFDIEKIPKNSIGDSVLLSFSEDDSNNKMIIFAMSIYSLKVECIEEVLGKTFEDELVKDMLTLMASFSAKIYGKRSQRQAGNSFRDLFKFAAFLQFGYFRFKLIKHPFQCAFSSFRGNHVLR